MAKDRGQGGVSYRAFAGLRNDVAPERFGPADLAVATNVDLDKTGRLARRQGYTRVVSTPAHSLWAQAATALFVSGIQLNRLNPDYSATPLATVGAARMSYCPLGERTYFSNSTATGVYEGGAVRSWGMAVPALPTAAVVGGALPAGAYQYTLTHVRADGQESGAALAGVIVSTGGAIELTLPALLDAAVVSRNVYLSPPDGDVLYLAATLPAAQLSYTVSAADVAQLALPLLTQFLQPAPAGQLVTYYKGYMFVACGTILYMSEPFAPELFDLRNYIDLGETITLLAPLEDRGASGGLFVGTTKSCGVLAGASPDDFQYVAKTEYGAITGALAYADGTLIGDGAVGARPLPIWLTTAGVCIGTPGMAIDNQTLGVYSFAASGNGAALFLPAHNRFVAVSEAGTLAMRTSATPEQKPRPESRMTHYTGYAFNSLATFNGVALGADAGGIYTLSGASDAGAPIAATLRLGNTDFGSSFLKGMDRLYAGYRAAAPMLLSALTDGVASPNYPLPATAGDTVGGRAKLGKGLQARYWQFTLSNTLGADFVIDALEVTPANEQRRVHA